MKAKLAKDEAEKNKSKLESDKVEETTSKSDSKIPLELLHETQRLRKSVEEQIDIGHYQQALVNAVAYTKHAKECYGAIHSETYKSLNTLALVFKLTGDRDSSQILLEKVLEGFTNLLGRGNP